MFDRAFYNNKTNNNYNELVDYQVQSMNKSEGPFNTEAYANYKELVNKEKEKIDPNNLTEHIYKLGYKIDTLLTKIIGQLDEISEGIEEEQNDNKEVEITVNPLTHKVTYNKVTNEYKVVERGDKK